MYKSVSLLLLLSLFVQNMAFADCKEPVVPLDQGQPSPCRGYLFTPDKEKEVYLINENYKLLQEEDGVKDKQINDYKLQVGDLKSAVTTEEQKAQLWQGKAEDSTQKLMQADSGRGTRDAVFLGLGILLTIGAGLAIGAAARR